MKCVGCGKKLTPTGIAAGECAYCHNFIPTPAEDEAEHAEHIKRLERRIADRVDDYDRDDLGLSEDWR
jgi:hypothetical protein